MRFLTLVPIPLTFTVGAILAGCGDGEKKGTEPKPGPPVPAERRGVFEAVDALQAASRDGDGDRICDDIFTPTLAKSVKAAAGASCAKEVKGNLFSQDVSLAVGRDVRIDGDRAVASVMDQTGKVSKLSMRKQGERWRVDAVTPVAPSGR